MPKIEDVEVSEMDQGNTVAPEHRAVTPAPHTPLPWYHRQAFQCHKFGDHYDWIGDHPDRGKHRKVIVCRDGASPEDMAFIVRAVNNHYALVEALEAMLTDPPATLDEPDTDAEVIIKMREIARAALSAAKGET